METNSTERVLMIHSSAQQDSSLTRRIGEQVAERLLANHPDADIITRDLANGLPFIDQTWVEANLTDPDQRTPAHQATLAESDRLIEELDSADVVVVTAPVYNFSVPAVLKAWIDMVCRARLTFRYTDQGPEGMLRDRPVYLVMASGGVPFGSAVDFASDYMKHIFGFIGITDVRPVFAERTNADYDASHAAALQALDSWLPEQTLQAQA